MRSLRYLTVVLFVCICSVALAIDPPTGLRISIPEPVGPFSAPTVVERSASRTTGVAPLSVHFSAGFTGSSSGTREFHDLDYTWDFGDLIGGNWGTSGRSKNLAKGAVATHIYEAAGTYTVTLTVRDRTGVVDSDTFTITVNDPDVVYSGTNTTCVSDIANSDFTGCPPGTRQIATDDLSTITQYAVAGSRILFHRGSSWTTSGLSFPNSSGPVTVGAYGTGTAPNELGIFTNAPVIEVTSGNFCDLSNKQDWRFMDLNLVDATRSNGSFGGTFNMQRLVFLRLRIEGFGTGVGWSHYNNSIPPMTIDQMVVSESEISDGASYGLYVGGERIALLGNVVGDSRTSHVVRVWQAFQGVISHNVISGSSLDTTSGRHALKLHGPGYSSFGNVSEHCAPEAGNTCLENRTEFAIVSDNVFGASGPWPVAMGPQDGATDAEVWDIVFERNRIQSDYGTQSPILVGVGLHIWGRYVTVRNNVFDGSGSGADYTAIVIDTRGVEPPPTGNAIYNNTMYRADNGTGNTRNGVEVRSTVSDTIISNNLVSFPGASMPTVLISDASGDVASSNNLMTDTPGFVDPDNPDPLLRDFSLLATSPGVDQGTAVPVFDDFSGTTRPIGAYDLGAFER